MFSLQDKEKNIPIEKIIRRFMEENEPCAEVQLKESWNGALLHDVHETTISCPTTTVKSFNIMHGNEVTLGINGLKPLIMKPKIAKKIAFAILEALLEMDSKLDAKPETPNTGA